MQFNGDRYKRNENVAKEAFISRNITEKVGSSTGSEREGMGIRQSRGGRERYSNTGKVGRGQMLKHLVCHVKGDQIFLKYQLYSYAVKFTLLKFTILWLFLYSQNCTIITTNFRTFSAFKRAAYTHQQPLSISPQYPEFQVTSNVHFVCMNLPVLDKWEHRICGLLWLASFT